MSVQRFINWFGEWNVLGLLVLVFLAGILWHLGKMAALDAWTWFRTRSH